MESKMQILTDADLDSIRFDGNVIQVYGSLKNLYRFEGRLYHQFDSTNYILERKEGQPPIDFGNALERLEQLRKIILG